jgi:hypothetical protein
MKNDSPLLRRARGFTGDNLQRYGATQYDVYIGQRVRNLPDLMSLYLGFFAATARN